MMLGHPMNIVAVLGAFTGLGDSAGIVMHLLLGSFGFAVGFLIVGPYLAGPGWLRGVTFMVGVWFVASLVTMPILGVGLFFGGVKEAQDLRSAGVDHAQFPTRQGIANRRP